jgi:predicted AlkP superfamily phosphohydrolase/phosphomutase
MGKARRILIGLDGMPYRLMKQFAEDGTMPHFGALVKQGTLLQMESSVPEVSSVAWSSIITGMNPGGHGVYGFTDIAPDSYRLTFPNYSTLKAQPFWNRPGEGRSVIINVPTTYPATAKEMNGVLIAGFVALDLDKAVYPQSLLPQLKEIDYRVDVDSQKGHISQTAFLNDLDKTLKARIAAYRHLWKTEAWDTFMLVFTGVDRLGHFMWDAYENPDHPHRQEFFDHFHQIDEVIGEIAGQLRDGDKIMMMSDHGFELIEQEFYPNHALEETGFLSFEDDATRQLRTITENTKAFALDPGRIYIHQEGRFPKGKVKAEDKESVLRDLIDLFTEISFGDKLAVKQIFRSEEIYSGPELERAPDLILLGEQGINLRGNMKAHSLFGREIFVGKHSQQDAFLFIGGHHNSGIIPDRVSVTDIVKILDAM